MGLVEDDGGWVRRVKAARELLQWNQEDLAAASGIGVATIRRFEAEVPVKDETRDALLAALRGAGAVFLEPLRAGRFPVKDGVALKANAAPKPRTRRGEAKPT